jgi:hypothetical protein
MVHDVDVDVDILIGARRGKSHHSEQKVLVP